MNYLEELRNKFSSCSKKFILKGKLNNDEQRYSIGLVYQHPDFRKFLYGRWVNASEIPKRDFIDSLHVKKAGIEFVKHYLKFNEILRNPAEAKQIQFGLQNGGPYIVIQIENKELFEKILNIFTVNNTNSLFVFRITVVPDELQNGEILQTDIGPYTHQITTNIVNLTRDQIDIVYAVLTDSGSTVPKELINYREKPNTFFNTSRLQARRIRVTSEHVLTLLALAVPNFIRIQYKLRELSTEKNIMFGYSRDDFGDTI